LFLTESFPALEKMGSLAENYLYADPNACLYKMGALAETIVNYMFELDSLKPPAGNDNTQANKVKILLREKLISKEINDIFTRIRISRNEAVHEGYDSFEECRALLEQTHTLAMWFMQTYGDDQFEALPFVLPDDIRNQADYQKLLDENEKLSTELAKAQAAALSKRVHTHVHLSERRRRAENATRNIKLSEREVRYIIDEQLRKVGWEADTFNLRYSKGTRPQKGRNLAIAEWPTDLTVCKWGYMDYALFAGLELVGVVEANADRHNILFAIDNQCREYSMGVKEEHLEYVIGRWGEYQVPFLFATNGRTYMKQMETKSGMWFRDARCETNMARVLQGWIGPQDLLDILALDISAANQKLKDFSYDLLRDEDGLGLRPYQIEAIEKTEAAIINGNQTALLEMAAGTGKTRIVPGIMHRFLQAGRFKRILLLVGPAAYGGQTPEIFKDVMIENHLALEQIYDIKTLDDTGLGKDTKIQVSTVQALFERIFINSDEPGPSVTDYDLIIADEACREYTPDRAISGEEDSYGNRSDHVNEYHAVLDYFDAIKIVLTADSSQHAADIFGKPLFKYSHRRAVSEGYLSDPSE
jgi:type I restriction enzyme R subunit